MNELKKAALRVAAEDFLNTIFSIRKYCYNTNFVVDNLLSNMPDFDLVVALKKSFEEGNYNNVSWDDARYTLMRHYDYISSDDADALIWRLKILSNKKRITDTFRLTKEGKKTITEFIEKCEKSRKEILDAGEDTVEHVHHLTEERVLLDINRTGIDGFGFYINVFSITDHYDTNGFSLWYWRDFI